MAKCKDIHSPSISALQLHCCRHRTVHWPQNTHADFETTNIVGSDAWRLLLRPKDLRYLRLVETNSFSVHQVKNEGLVSIHIVRDFDLQALGLSGGI